LIDILGTAASADGLVECLVLGVLLDAVLALLLAHRACGEWGKDEGDVSGDAVRMGGWKLESGAWREQREEPRSEGEEP